MVNETKRRIPVTILTGYLGSGKTTLLNKLIDARHGKNIFVLMNEFGEVDIDGKLLIRSEEQLIEFNNGCLCCTVRQDLIRILTDLGENEDYDGVFIETTGLADPAPIASTFFVVDEIREKFKVDSFITVVDAFNIEENLNDSHEAMEQISFADIVILNKIDTIDEEKRKYIEKKIRVLNPIATMYSTKNCDVDSESLLDTNAFELNIKLEVDPTFLEDIPHTHDNSITSLVLTEERPIDENYFQAYISNILNEKKMQILRSKGVFYSAKQENKVIFQTVRMLSTIQSGELWGEDESRKTEYVVIGRNLDKKELQRVMKLSARKKRSIQSVSKNGGI